MNIKNTKWKVVILILAILVVILLIFWPTTESKKLTQLGYNYAFPPSSADVSPDYPKATAAFQKALELDSNNKEALYGLARVLMITEGCSVASGYLERLLSLDPNNEEGLRSKASCLKIEGRYEEAAKVYDKLTKLHPSGWQYYDDMYNRIDSLKKANKTEDAILAYEEYLTVLPKCEDCWKEKGDLEFELGQYSEALQSYNKAYDIVLEELEGSLSTSDYKGDKLNSLELKINQTQEKLNI